MIHLKQNYDNCSTIPTTRLTIGLDLSALLHIQLKYASVFFLYKIVDFPAL
ncbi:hypothetical protein D1BOALGB6SA_5274 [Olavius sp. associated proteobacterium Delta 1]|nr:hypothetical protein D1BOALGB6SA_5274 [Olavius sp. associated proteobacterium Delta 1]